MLTLIMRTVVCGIGNRMRGDDAAGPMVIDGLKRSPSGRNSDRVLLLDCGHFPENFVKKIIGFRPGRIILVDTADFGGKPGDFREISKEEIKYHVLSTHRMPLTMLVDYLKSEIDFEFVFLGIQPGQTGFGDPVSRECQKAVEEATGMIREMVARDRYREPAANTPKRL